MRIRLPSPPFLNTHYHTIQRSNNVFMSQYSHVSSLRPPEPTLDNCSPVPAYGLCSLNQSLNAFLQHSSTSVSSSSEERTVTRQSTSSNIKEVIFVLDARPTLTSSRYLPQRRTTSFRPQQPLYTTIPLKISLKLRQLSCNWPHDSISTTVLNNARVRVKIPGWIYCFRIYGPTTHPNAALYKVRRTTDYKRRVLEWRLQCPSYRHEWFVPIWVDDMYGIEKAVHAELDGICLQRPRDQCSNCQQRHQEIFELPEIPGLLNYQDVIALLIRRNVAEGVGSEE
ncbi:hypothetical protein PM082_011940 [Marasmius tenuissimus]|nr:hypothetical protein PM082_011940 [Marasmius tenuissimus]